MLKTPVRRTLSITLVLVAAPGAAAQTVPWDRFEDRDEGGSLISDSFCGLVNAANAELVVRSDTGELVIVSGPDVTLGDTTVTLEGDVFHMGNPAGFIAYDTDGDGFRTVWWLSLTGRVVDVDQFTGQPTPTDLFPTDFFDVPCDACNLWDGPNVCVEPIVVEPIVAEPTVPPITINLCGANLPLAMAMTFAGLVTTGRVRRRYA